MSAEKLKEDEREAKLAQDWASALRHAYDDGFRQGIEYGHNERNEMRKVIADSVEEIVSLNQRISELEEQLDRERAANERLTHDCEIARQHLLKAISEKDNGHV